MEVDAIEDMLYKISLSGSIVEDVKICLVGEDNVLEKEGDIVCQDNINLTIPIPIEKNIPD